MMSSQQEMLNESQILDMFQSNLKAKSTDLFDDILYDSNIGVSFGTPDSFLGFPSGMQEEEGPDQKSLSGNNRGEELVEVVEDQDQIPENNPDSEYPQPPSNDSDYSLNQQQARRRRLKKEESAKKNLLKNILPTIMGLIVQYIKDHYMMLKTAENCLQIEQGMEFVDSLGHNINRDLFVSLFKIEIFQPLFQEMFASTYLQREIQLCRASPVIRSTYISKVKVFYKVFIKKAFPRLK